MDEYSVEKLEEKIIEEKDESIINNKKFIKKILKLKIGILKVVKNI